jgi:predicted nucleic acid-binding protein
LATKNETIIQLACDMIELYPLRGCDAIHLSTALNAHRQLVAQGRPGIVFLSADDRLNHAATAEGLTVDNPNHHP